MAAAAHPDRRRFREHPLDGAMLYFHPETGTSVHVRTEATRRFRRRAPRVVMFGITNACNLSCGFCSRDTARPSRWSVDTAAEVLEGLAEAGTLEVAFGGGEPFAFRGFEELLLRVHVTTALALNVTTNGELATADTLARLASVVGQLRLSLYDGRPWRDAARRFAGAGVRWGANLLVDDAALEGLPAILHEVAALGARDMSLLAYVGPDAGRHLSRDGEERLAAIVHGSPLPCRVSVCFGDRVSVPRLFDGADDSGDCGAGLDFVTLTPDMRVQACSFQETSWPATTAADVLDVLGARREALAAATTRAGCARAFPRRAPPRREGISVWQSFSGNNSGECLLVAKFETEQRAAEVLAELLPGYTPDERYSAPWKELFRREGVDGPTVDTGLAPDEMLAVGRTLVATGYDAGDSFPELRAFAWRRGGDVLPGGIHVHADRQTLFAVRARSADDARAVAATAKSIGAIARTYGDRAVIAMRPSTKGPCTVSEMVEAVRRVATGRPLALELFFDEIEESALDAALQHLDRADARRSRMLLSFWGDAAEERARRVAASVEGSVTHVDRLVLVDGIGRQKRRLAVHGQRQGAYVAALEAEAVVVSASCRREAREAPADRSGCVPRRARGAAPAGPGKLRVLDRVVRGELGRGRRRSRPHDNAVGGTDRDRGCSARGGRDSLARRERFRPARASHRAIVPRRRRDRAGAAVTPGLSNARPRPHPRPGIASTTAVSTIAAISD